ncbi:hypothetical protein N0V85_008047, partial [Neurospora sp. IMI 360204]
MGAESSKVARKLPKNATAASIAAASRSGAGAAPRAPPPRVNGGQEASQSQMESASSDTYEGSGSPLDAIGDPAFAARLRQLSATVQPNPIHSPSSTIS